MKHLYIILLILPLIGFGQTEYVKHYYDNGQLQRESIIKDGVEKLKFYDKEGNLLPKEEGC